MLTPQEQQKVAFLHACAERGLTIVETHKLIKKSIALIESGEFEKQAATGFFGGLVGGAMNRAGKIFDKAIDFGGAALLGTGKAIGTAALLAPILAGGVTGYALGKGGGTSEEDIAETKQQELIDAYRQAADRIRSKSRIAKRKSARPIITRSLI